MPRKMFIITYNKNKSLPQKMYFVHSNFKTWLRACTHPPGMTLPRTARVQLNHICTGVGRFRSCIHKWVSPPLQPVSVVQKNKPSTMLSSNVRSIDSPRTARSDRSGWWDNWMTAQPPPWYLVQCRISSNMLRPQNLYKGPPNGDL